MNRSFFTRTFSLLIGMLFLLSLNSIQSQTGMILAGPPDLTVSDVVVQVGKKNPTRVVIEWKTNKEAGGRIEYGLRENDVTNIAYDVKGKDYRGQAHRVVLKGLEQNTKYFFVIIANKQRFDNRGTLFQLTTKAASEPAPTTEPRNKNKKDTFRARLRAQVRRALKTVPQELEGVRVPTNVRLLKLKFNGRTLTLNLSKEATALGTGVEFQELLNHINMFVNEQFEKEGLAEKRSLDYEILIEGAPLFEHEPAIAPERTEAIGGKKIVVSPGHGRFYNGSSWVFQRGTYNGIIEDLITPEFVSDLTPKLTSVGADVRPARQLNKNAGNHSSGYAWWEMSAREYVKSLGAPEWVWNSGDGMYNQDIMARPYYARWLGANALVSIHTNGGGGCGTETWYDTGNGYQTQSLDLANRIQAKIIERVRAQYSSSWCNRGVKGSNAAYGENRWFTGPAVVIEVGFHDNTTDANALKSATFRAIVGTAIKDALVEYFGGNTCNTDNNEPNNSQNQARAINENQTYQGYICPANDPDWFKFYASAGTQFRVDLTSVPYDYDLKLYNSSGAQLAASTAGGTSNESISWTATYSGDHFLQVYGYSGATHATDPFDLRWQRNVTGCTTIPQNQYCGEYYNNRTLSGSPTFIRNDSSINVDWGNNGPGGGIGNDNFSVRWRGSFNFNSGTYTFITTSDDGIRLYVDDVNLIDKWFDQGPTTYTATRTMSAGYHTIRVEYYENGGGAVARASWSQNTTGLTNGNFESGRNVGWSEYASNGLAIVSTNFPRTGSWSAYFCDYNNCTDQISQQIRYSSNQRLSFWWYMRSSEVTTTPYDYLRVELLSTSGTVLATLATYSNTNYRNGWVQTLTTLPSGYAGQTVVLRFRGTSDSSVLTAFYVDDVSLQ